MCITIQNNKNTKTYKNKTQNTHTHTLKKNTQNTQPPHQKKQKQHTERQATSLGAFTEEPLRASSKWTP